MNVLLICPAERPDVPALSETEPLANLQIFGKPFVHHWLEYLSDCGATNIKILVADRPERIRQSVGNGSRWGLRVEVIPESDEMSCAGAEEKYFPDQPKDAQTITALIDHLPGFPEQKLFESYPKFFAAIQFWISQHPSKNQIGLKEIKPGVWVGMRTQISPRARLIAPCWIGENVLVKADTTIGPMAVLENGVVVEDDAIIYESWVGSQTFAGTLIQVKDSLVLGNTLVNFRTDSLTKIPDAFLLCSLKDSNYRPRPGNIFGRVAALLAMALTAPFALITILKAKWQGHRALRPRRATAPLTTWENCPAIIYFEFANSNGWWRRWPQLWNIARGEFTWIGNRPLTLIEAGKLTNEFERLWLAAPIGLISQGDAEGCTDISSDEARAHASFYAAQANLSLDIQIFCRAVDRLVNRKASTVDQNESLEIKTRTVPID